MQLQIIIQEQNKVKESMTKELTRLTILADEVKTHCNNSFQRLVCLE